MDSPHFVWLRSASCYSCYFSRGGYSTVWLPSRSIFLYPCYRLHCTVFYKICICLQVHVFQLFTVLKVLLLYLLSTCQTVVFDLLLLVLRTRYRRCWGGARGGGRSSASWAWVAARRCHVDMVGLRRHIYFGILLTVLVICWGFNLIDFVITLIAILGLNAYDHCLLWFHVYYLISLV